MKNERYPRKVEYLAAHHITEICCGHRHTIFITDKGEAFSCGEGVDGKLGHGDEESLLFPKLNQSLKGVGTGACGRHHSCAILSDNTLYAFGSGTRGQLGYSNSEAAAVGNPIFPTGHKHIRCVEVSCPQSGAFYFRRHGLRWGP